MISTAILGHPLRSMSMAISHSARTSLTMVASEVSLELRPLLLNFFLLSLSPICSVAAFRAYQDYVARNGADPVVPTSPPVTPNQLFFLSFAQGMLEYLCLPACFLGCCIVNVYLCFEI